MREHYTGCHEIQKFSLSKPIPENGPISELREAVVQHKPLAVTLDGEPLGELFLHRDARPKLFGQLSRYLGWVAHPEELQEMIDIGAIIQFDEGNSDEVKLTRVHSVVTEAVHSMNKRFLESVDLEPTHKKVLCAFTSNVDAVCFLKDDISAQQKIDRAVQDAIGEGATLGKPEKQVVGEIEHIIYECDPKKLPSKAKTKAQIVGFILRMFQNTGKKRSVVGKDLADWIRNVFQPEPELEKVGGASAQMADFLTGIGEKNVTVYTQFHSPDQAQAYKKPTNFLRVNDGEFTINTVDVPESMGSDDPTKVNYPIERSPGIAVRFNGREIKAGPASDREIFTTEYYNSKGKPVNFKPLFEFNSEVLTKIGSEFEYFIINGPHYLQRYTQKKYNQVAPHMAAQLGTLKDAGVKIHYEFSGNTSRKKREGHWRGLKYFDDILKGNIHSMGINHKELKEIVDEIKTELDPTIEVAGGGDPYSMYKNAVTLAEYLGLDRLYVHGHSVDMTVRKNADIKALEKEVKADLHAKQRVVEWLKGDQSTYKTPDEKRLSSLLKREGFIDLMKFAEALAAHSGLDVAGKAKLMREVLVDGYHYNAHQDGYSVVIVPVKWIYGETKVTTSSGDITSSCALIQSGL